MSFAKIQPTKGNNTEKAGKFKSRANGVASKVLLLIKKINEFCIL